MTRTIRAIMALALCALASPAAAQCATQFRPNIAVHHGQQLQAYTAHGYTVQLQQINPYVYPYAVYSVGQGIREEATSEAIFARVLQKLEARLDKMAPAAQNQQPQAWHPGATLLAQRCASCHKQGSKAVADDGAPVLFTVENKWQAGRDASLKAVTLAKRGGMPPQPATQLTVEEFLAVKGYFEAVYPPAKAAEAPAPAN